MAWLICSALSALASPDLFLHVRSDFLTSDSTSYYTVENEYQNIYGSPYEFVDSTFFVTWDLNGYARSRELLRAEWHVYDAGSMTWTHHERFLAPLDVNRILAGRKLPLAMPVTHNVPASFRFQSDGIFLALGQDSVLIAPVETFLHSFPEYPELIRYREFQDMRFLNLYSGDSDRLFLHIQADCLDTETDCRQVVVPVSKAGLDAARWELLERSEEKKK